MSKRTVQVVAIVACVMLVLAAGASLIGGMG